MKDRAKFFVVALFLSLIFSVGAVCAQEDMSFEQSNVEVPVGTVDVDPDINQENNNDNDIGPDSSNNVVGAGNDNFIVKTNHTVSGNSFKNIQDAIDNANSGDVIFLQGGSFIGSGAQINVNKDNITIVGGSTFDDGKYVTLDAQKKSRIMYVSGSNVIIQGVIFTNGHGNGDDVGAMWGGSAVNCTFKNNYGFHTGAMYRSSAVNCTFINNVALNGGAGAMRDCSAVNSTFKGNGAYYGGAMWGGSAVNCTFISNYARGDPGGAIRDGNAVNCIFIGNSAGWGGAMSGGSARNCTFINNTATSTYMGGGAMYGGSAENCNFSGNSAKLGGAISEGSARNCIFINNTAEKDGGAIYKGSAENCNFSGNSAGYGGAMWGGSAENSTFINNTAKVYGGAIRDCSAVNCTFTGNSAEYGGAASQNSIVNCTFTDNNATFGGAMYYGTAENCTFIGNSALINGGAMGFAAAVNCTFTNNAAGEDGGAMEYSTALNCTFTSNAAGEDGGAINMGQAENSTFINNSANRGGAMWCKNMNVINCIFVDNTAVCGSALYIAGSAVISDSCIFDNLANSTSLELIVNLTGNNVTVKSVLTGGDNLLNGIYAESGNVSLRNVSYLGFDGLMNTGKDMVTPVASADLSDNGTLVYMDSREAGQNITIEIYRNGIPYYEDTILSDIYGVVSVAFTDLKPGNYTVKSYLRKNSYYTLINSSESLFTIDSVATFIVAVKEFDVLATDYNAGERGNFIYATLADEDGNPLFNKTIQIAINGVIYNFKTNEEGIAGIKINLASANTYTCAWFFQGDELYNASLLASSRIVINKKPITISASNCVFKASAKTKTVTAKITTRANPYDGKTYLAKNKLVTLTLNGRIYNGRTDENGVVKFNIQVTKKGTYNAVIKFAGDRTYEAASKTIKITLDDKGSTTAQKASAKSIVLTSSNNGVGEKAIPTSNLDSNKNSSVIDAEKEFTRMACDYEAGEKGDYFYVTLKDSNGNVLSNKTVQIAVNGPIYNVTTDKNGTAALMINLASANTYTYALAFSGDGEYNAAPLVSSKLIVVKKPITITAKDQTFKATAKTKTVTATLSTSKNPYDGKTYLSHKKVTLKVDGKTYTGTIDGAGKVSFNVQLTKKGTYSAVISFDGDKTYESAAKTIKITVK